MGDTALLIGVAYAAVVVLATAVTLVIWASTRGPRRDADPVDAHKLAEFEKRWLLIVAAILLALLLATIWLTPYGNSADGGGPVVRVGAQQFAWTVVPARVPLGEDVTFLTTSKDVNHGFGIYKGTKFVAQVQVVPGKTQKLVHRFTEPGTYTILCLEFCGAGHHVMKAHFEVGP